MAGETRKGVKGEKKLVSRYMTVRPQPKSRSDTGGRLDDRSGKVTKAAVVPPVVREVLKSPGIPLDMATRAFMEPRFGHDFSKVRVHADDRAAESAQAVNALAYTAGSHVVFGAGGYRPESDGGKRLLAHELAHVVQQGQREGAAVTSVSSASSPHEAEALQAAQGALSSRGLKATANLPGAGLARQPAEPGKDEKPASLPPPKQTAPAEQERDVEAVVVGEQTYVIYQKEVRTGGSSSWLANNPGNLDYTPEVVAWGAYDGKKLPWGKHRFAIFSHEETGHLAIQKFLRTHQGERDINLMMHLYAPAGDRKNKPNQYATEIAAALEVPVTTLVKTLTDKQLIVFANEIQRVEGWHPGTTYARGDPSLPKQVRDR